MNVLSLFDGMSCGQIALERSGLKVDNYFASEIDKYAIQVCLNNFPGTKQLGNVVDVDLKTLPNIDLLIGGSPCQDISNMNQFKLGLGGEKSGLFYQYWRMWQEIKNKNPKALFLLENVAGDKGAVATITKILGVRPMKFNSCWVSAQKRPRLYWTNIPVNSIPQKKHLSLNSILENMVDDRYYQSPGWIKWFDKKREFLLNKQYCTLNPEKAICLTRRMYANWSGNFIQDEKGIRRLTPVECERLQTVPDGFTSCVDDRFRYEMLGNGWTVDIIAHILSHLPKETKLKPQ